MSLLEVAKTLANMERAFVLADEYQLTGREGLAIRRRGEGKTLDEVGYEIGVTRESVRVIQAKAERKIDWPWRSFLRNQYLHDLRDPG